MNNPVWIDDKGKIVEPEYCRDFLTRHPMRCINERFYTVDGPLPDESKLKRTIYEEISPWLHAKVAQTVEQVIKALQLAAYADPLPLHCDRIHVANGTYFLDGTFTEEKEYCGNRLSVSYRADAPAPQHWLRFLSELLEPEDIPALQEYLGYCLIPSTKGQKMLMLIGKGGEGKSRIGVVMNAIFGLNMNTTSIQKVENNRFARADLEGKLLMIDDDLDMNALTKTNYVKSIVTAELRMDLERKKEQSYEWVWYKSRCTGFLNARRAPLKKTENILVFYQKLPLYNPQFEQGKPYKKIAGNNGNSTNYGKFTRSGSGSEDGLRFPGNVLTFPAVQRTVHPTQKPVALCEYFIKTYTRPGEVVADICAGSATTAVAALNTGRRFICFETVPAYYAAATERIRLARAALEAGEKGV